MHVRPVRPLFGRRYLYEKSLLPPTSFSLATTSNPLYQLVDPVRTPPATTTLATKPIQKDGTNELALTGTNEDDSNDKNTNKPNH